MPYLGAHISISGGIFLAPQRARALGCDTMQVFTKSQRMWKAGPLKDADIAAFVRNCQEERIVTVVAHTSYLINLGSPDTEKLKKSREGFSVELDRAKKLHIPFLIFHPGSHMGDGESRCIRRIAESLDWIIEHESLDNVIILLETTAGQGTNVGYRFEHLRDIISYSRYSDKLGVCYDTCHTFAAGYDIRNAESYKKTFRLFDTIIGIDKLFVFHLNDSKKELNSRKDRHEHIGIGQIGLAGFKLLLNDKRFKKHPMILETPGGDKYYPENLKKLKSLMR
ncbi:MAG: deoxyribonuclease IV [Candidatus Cloacimonas sp. 4484_209]|nr:MAG: deoxyribonuclease IV [Candidatus Cloacimonas sp. 4484_209]